eukprot:19998_1
MKITEPKQWNSSSTEKSSLVKSVSAKTSLEEASIIFGMFFKIATCGVMLFLPTAISYTFIGHYGENSTELMAGAGLGRIFTNVTALSFAWGITLGLQTLVPQAIGNDNELQSKFLLSLYTQQCLLISIIGLIPLSILQFFSGDILCAIGQPHDLCSIISAYCQCLIPFLWLTNFLMIVQRVCRPLMYNTELMIIFTICAFINYLLNYIFVDILQYNYLWTAFSVDITQLITLLMIIAMLCYKGHSYIFRLLPLQDILQWNDGLYVYLKLSIPGLIQTASSWWITELVVLFTGFITIDTSVALTATAIATQVNSFGRVITIGLCAPVAIRVGHYIGSGDIIRSKRSAKIAFGYFDTVLLIILFSIIYCFRDKLPTIWSNDYNVINLCSDLLIIGAVFQIPYNIFYFLGCLYRGLGFPQYAAIFLAVSQYLIGVPLQIVTLFYLRWRDELVLGSVSIWSVVTLGYILALTGMLIHLKFFVNWDKAVSHSQQRIKRVMKPNVTNYGAIQTEIECT